MTKVPDNAPAWVKLAYADLGVKEVPGPRDNPRVLQYFVDAAHPEIKHDEVPWCAGFVGAMLKRAGVKPSGSLAARSYEPWGQPVARPTYGCIGVKKRPGAGWVGHVGFVLGANKTEIIMISGNAQDQVIILPFPRKLFTAYRWPANIEIPKDLPPLMTTVAGVKAGIKEV